MKKYKDTYRVKSTRLESYDYSSPGFYFVTMCTKHRTCFLGVVNGSRIELTKQGIVADVLWNDLQTRSQGVRTHEFVILPDHLHCVVEICEDSTKNLASIIGGYKAAVTKHCNRMRAPFGWQPRFYEHVIRNEQSYRRITQYMQDNPKRWIEKHIT